MDCELPAFISYGLGALVWVVAVGIGVLIIKMIHEDWLD